MVLEERNERALVGREARKARRRALDSAVIRREEREPAQARVEDVEEGLGARRVRARVVVRHGHLAERGLRVRKGRVVNRDRLRERLRDGEHVVDDVDGDVARRRRVRHDRVIAASRMCALARLDARSGEGCAQLVEHVNLAVGAGGPRDDLVLSARLEMDELRVAEEGAPEGGVGVVGLDTGEVAGDDVVRDEVGERVEVRRER